MPNKKKKPDRHNHAKMLPELLSLRQQKENLYDIIAYVFVLLFILWCSLDAMCPYFCERIRNMFNR